MKVEDRSLPAIDPPSATKRPLLFFLNLRLRASVAYPSQSVLIIQQTGGYRNSSAASASRPPAHYLYLFFIAIYTCSHSRPYFSRSPSFPCTTVVPKSSSGDDLLVWQSPGNSMMHSRRSSHQLPGIKDSSLMYPHDDTNTPPHSPFNRNTLRRVKRVLKRELLREQWQQYVLKANSYQALTEGTWPFSPSLFFSPSVRSLVQIA